MNELLWHLSRASGITALGLLTATLVLGAWSVVTRRPDRAAVGGLGHRNLELGSVVFLAVHVATAIAETYVSIDLVSLLLPFTSAYERLFVGLGTLALDLLIAVVVTALLRDRLGRGAFRVIHGAVWGLWAVAVLHGLALSSDTPSGLRWLTVACAVAGSGALAVRILTPASRDLAARRLAGSRGWS